MMRFWEWFEGEEVQQAAWERRHSILRALAAGATCNEIAAHLGIKSTAVKGLIDKANTEERKGLRSPLERELAKGPALLIQCLASKS